MAVQKIIRQRAYLVWKIISSFFWNTKLMSQVKRMTLFSDQL